MIKIPSGEIGGDFYASVHIVYLPSFDGYNGIACVFNGFFDFAIRYVA